MGIPRSSYDYQPLPENPEDVQLRRSLKYELIYIKAFDNGHHLQREVDDWFNWYNQQRLNQSLDYQTPNQVYAAGLMA
ncbi:MAG: integrase core domain-containing protein [Pelatocladus maniniholoensis HA4357-MV3]|uniref:Integrase core domain-containing protein n=1 Tax=Pelatocladus maniniholoensis HA4357-MV3 TaxID=1117104 RepID=A0A9E3LR86_9NOST|nr:integrase core domain-containing protein [Pelatocladus maniniholoensis HA4357-MV3]